MDESLRSALEQVYEGGSRLSRLTRRQLEVLSLMAKGYNNASIARALVLEEKSVENHINAIFGHLRVSRDGVLHRRVKAVLLYLQDGARASGDFEDEAPSKAA
jgi:DNA-binding NarL/FixJ family response regulator